VTEITLKNLLKGMKEAMKRDIPTLPNGAHNLAERIFEMAK
jgi:hypothetical protein